MTSEFDKLRDIAWGADYIAAIVLMRGEFARLLSQEVTVYKLIAGPRATQRGLMRHMGRLDSPELRRSFASDFEILTGLER